MRFSSLRDVTLGAAFRAVTIFSVVGALSGCTVLRIVDLAAAGQDEKQKTLGERVAKFHRELYWGTGSQYMEYIVASQRSGMGRALRQAQEVEKLVDLEIRGIDFKEEDSDVADVDVKVRYYKKSSLQVAERFEKETWEYFRFRGGWFLKSRDIEPTESLTEPVS